RLRHLLLSQEISQDRCHAVAQPVGTVFGTPVTDEAQHMANGAHEKRAGCQDNRCENKAFHRTPQLDLALVYHRAKDGTSPDAVRRLDGSTGNRCEMYFAGAKRLTRSAAALKVSVGAYWMQTLRHYE